MMPGSSIKTNNRFVAVRRSIQHKSIGLVEVLNTSTKPTKFVRLQSAIELKLRRMQRNNVVLCILLFCYRMQPYFSEQILYGHTKRVN